MAAKNKYVMRSEISEAKFRQFARLFCVDLNATQIALVTGLNRNTVNRLLHGLRERIAAACGGGQPVKGEVEVDESYFGARRVRGKRGRGASGKTIVFGIFKREGGVYTEIVPDCSKATLQGVIRGRINPDTVIHSDGWPGTTGWWTWATRSTTGSATAGTSSPGGAATSTAWRASGATPRPGWHASGACTNTLSCYT